MKIVLRPIDRETDIGLILSTWPKNAYHSAARKIESAKSDWFARMHLYVQVELKRAATLIACFEENPNQIAGYAVIDDECLEFVWVKPLYRNKGVAHMLLSRSPITQFNPLSLTKEGEKLVQELGLVEKCDEKTRICRSNA